MGATSVTGVSGPGTVAGKQKGSEHMSLSVKKLVGPHIVAGGVVTLVGTTGVVEIPAQGVPPTNSEFFPDSVSNYQVQLTSNSAVVPYVSTPLAAVASTNTWSFGVTAGAGAIVNWIVIKNGL